MEFVKLFKVRAQKCPVCDVVLNAASNLENDASPKPGDFTICIKCKSVLIFGEEMNLELAPKEIVDSLSLKTVNVMPDDVVQQLESKKYSITKNESGQYILCHLCGRTSHDNEAVKNKFCNHCHQYLA